MPHLLVLALLFLVNAQTPPVIPSRAYTDFASLGETFVPLQIENGFRVANVVYWSVSNANVKGTQSMIVVDLKDHQLGSSGTFTIDPQAKFILGWAVPGSNKSIMVLNRVDEGMLSYMNHSFEYKTESITEPNCIEDADTNSIDCNGTITKVRTTLISSVRQEKIVRNGYLPILSGQIDWSRNRLYLISIGSNFTIYTFDVSANNFRYLSQIQIKEANDTSGFAEKTQISEDGSILYILTTTNRFYRILNINTSTPEIDFLMTITRYDGLNFVVSDRYEEALVTTAGFPSVLLYIDIEQRRVYEKTILFRLYSPRVILKDAEAGFAYIAGFNSPSLFNRINLETHEVDQFFRGSDSGRAGVGFIDTATSSIFLDSDRTSYHVRYPGACLGDCSGHGTCGFGGVCVCDEGWQGDACDYKKCPSGFDSSICSGNGKCAQNGTCDCFAGYAGEQCETFTCTGDCSGNGKCDLGTHKCICNPGYSSADCSVSLLRQCEVQSTCKDCSKLTLCVWCESNQSCIFGDINGPLLDYCPDWQYRNCNWVAFIVIGWIYVAIAFIFLIMNIIWTIVEDRRGSNAILEKGNFFRNLWIAQRDHQTWLIIEQVQIGALLAYLGTSFPSNFKSFTDPLSVMILSVRPPWQEAHLPEVPWRTVQNLLQTANTRGASPLDLMAGSFFVFLLIIGFCLIYGVIAFASRNEMAIWRFPHILLRAIQFCQPGLVALGAYTVTQTNQDHTGSWSWGFSIAAAYISVIGIGFLYPLATLAFVVLKKRDLFQPHYRIRFGSLYETYHHDKLWFHALTLFKTGAIAMFIGFFADQNSGSYSAAASMVLPMITIAIYILACVVARPFIDKVRGIIQQVFLGIFNILIFGLCLVYLSFEPYDGWAVGIAALIGGTIFFLALMYLMNHRRINVPVPYGTDGGDNSYVRM